MYGRGDGIGVMNEQNVNCLSELLARHQSRLYGLHLCAVQELGRCRGHVSVAVHLVLWRKFESISARTAAFLPGHARTARFEVVQVF